VFLIIAAAAQESDESAPVPARIVRFWATAAM